MSLTRSHVDNSAQALAAPPAVLAPATARVAEAAPSRERAPQTQALAKSSSPPAAPQDVAPQAVAGGFASTLRAQSTPAGAAAQDGGAKVSEEPEASGSDESGAESFLPSLLSFLGLQSQAAQPAQAPQQTQQAQVQAQQAVLPQAPVATSSTGPAPTDAAADASVPPSDELAAAQKLQQPDPSRLSAAVLAAQLAAPGATAPSARAPAAAPAGKSAAQALSPLTNQALPLEADLASGKASPSGALGLESKLALLAALRGQDGAGAGAGSAAGAPGADRPAAPAGQFQAQMQAVMDAASQSAGSAPALGASSAQPLVAAAPLLAGAHADTASLRLPNGDSQQWQSPLMQALGDRIQLQLATRSEQAHIRLEPPQMGHIDITVRQQAGALQVQLSASHGEVLRQLQQISEGMRWDLSQRHAGGEVSVQVSSAAQSGSGLAGREGERGQGGGRQLQEEELPTRALRSAQDESATSAFALS